MRKTPALGALFPTVRGHVLAATLTQPDKWWYLSELAQFIGTTPSSLQRELKALVNGGILEQRREGTRIYFKAETRSPLFPELRGLLEKTAGLLLTLRQALKLFAGRIDCAFVTDTGIAGLSADRRFATAYNAAPQAANMAIACAGYRVTANTGHHKMTFYSANLALGSAADKLRRLFRDVPLKAQRDRLHAIARRDRNRGDRDRGGSDRVL
jgi:DNA-binding transcriptional ArsR family regulator